MRLYHSLQLACSDEHDINYPRTCAQFFLPYTTCRASIGQLLEREKPSRCLAKQARTSTNYLICMTMCANFHKESKLSECPHSYRRLSTPVIMSSAITPSSDVCQHFLIWVPTGPELVLNDQTGDVLGTAIGSLWLRRAFWWP